MKKHKAAAVVLSAAMAAGAVLPVSAEGPSVQVSRQSLIVGGVDVAAEVYNIDGYNYFKLRDVAAMLNYTPSQFSVGYDAASNTAAIESRLRYLPVGGELTTGIDNSSDCAVSAQKITVNGETIDVTVYNIGGYNFFRLRDLGELIGFSVEYDDEADAIVIDPDAYYVTDAERASIEKTLDLSNTGAEWTYSESSDSWAMGVVTAVTHPEIEDQQGVSVCVPGAYVKGVDTDGDGSADITSGTAKGSLVIDYDAKIVSSNGVEYTARTAPVILNTGAAGYGSSTNTVAASTYAGEGYINVSCGNRGKQDSVKDENGNVLYYTGDAPSCLVDQKCAARFVKYNILLGNLPGDPDRFVSTGGSGGGAHAAMFALTGNNPDFYDYEIAAGAVGIYKNASGGYSQTFGGGSAAISDGAWGCVAYSAITSLYEGDMTMAFEYFLDVDYEFSTPFQKKVAEYLSAEYMDYINGKNLSVKESDVGFDLDGDGSLDSEIALTIEYDAEKYPDTNGYGGSYLDLYLAEFNENLQWYLDNLDYAEGWTWFDADGAALSDEAVAAMTTSDKAQAFIEGRYTKASSRGGMTGGPDGGNFGGGAPGGMDGAGGPPSGGFPGGNDGGRSFDNSAVAENSSGDTMDVGTPDAGTTQAAGSSVNSSNYASYGAMLSAYESDIAEISEGDRFGRNIVDLYNPLNYISSIDTDRPAWTRILMGASEGDMSMLASLNLRIAALNAGIDAALEWQWDGGHVPSEIFGESLALWVDSMYAKHVSGSDPVVKAAAEPQTANGTSESPTGTDISSWVKYEDGKASVTIADAVSYRTAGASKAIPGFDVIDYGQEDYVFGSYDKDARHWSLFVLKVLKANADILAELF